MKLTYSNVDKTIGNATMLNTACKTLVGINLGAIFTWDHIWVKTGIGLFGILCLLGMTLTQKYIDLNSPGKVNQVDSSSK